jgi:hypothetical protein
LQSPRTGQGDEGCMLLVMCDVMATALRVALCIDPKIWVTGT